MNEERFVRYPNPNPQVQARIDHNRRFGMVTVRRGSRWETTAICIGINDFGFTPAGALMREVITEQGAFLATSPLAYCYDQSLVGCRVRFRWTRGEVRRFICTAPFVVEYQPEPEKPPGVRWAPWHEICRQRGQAVQ